MSNRFNARSKVSGFAALVLVTVGAPAWAQDQLPEWAYPLNTPGIKLPADDGTLRRVPDSKAGYTLTQVRDRFIAPDWHPGDHPPMPDIVANGRKPNVFACGYCHRADGPGGPENANLRGLPAAYIIRQIAEFKSGARKSSAPQRGPAQLKAQLVKDLTDAEAAAAAAYFSSLKPSPIIRVVETDTVPKTYVTSWHYTTMPSGEREPIGQRIIEMPEDLEQFVSRDSRARFVAYVPKGSIKAGQTLATTGGGRTVPCGTCHGANLKGINAMAVPGIAGRSPSYLVRQLYDFKHGARAGSASVLMKSSVANLTVDDMLALAAYANSLAP